jgi:hypothetical protein
MVVVRITFRVKRPHVSELIELLKDSLETRHQSGRVYSSRNTWDTVSLEIEFESDEDLHKWWTADWTPEGREFMKKLSALRESGSTLETLDVH